MAIEIVLIVRDTANNTEARRFLTAELIGHSNVNIASIYLDEMLSKMKELQSEVKL